ncbi:MAG: hypothetical protein EZS28_013476 [Streblomastix strix]|uniref:Uncharacterized protein n=1 Tax=Streblomastix strix TaxID=222440 RepID=A0A5J4W8M5_9EUKA|nr:MAG: hypothetical protein EZS28_013476 [Streblomastix strix]
MHRHSSQNKIGIENIGGESQRILGDGEEQQNKDSEEDGKNKNRKMVQMQNIDDDEDDLEDKLRGIIRNAIPDKEWEENLDNQITKMQTAFQHLPTIINYSHIIRISLNIAIYFLAGLVPAILLIVFLLEINGHSASVLLSGYRGVQFMQSVCILLQFVANIGDTDISGVKIEDCNNIDKKLYRNNKPFNADEYPVIPSDLSSSTVLKDYSHVSKDRIHLQELLKSSFGLLRDITAATIEGQGEKNGDWTQDTKLQMATQQCDESVTYVMFAQNPDEPECPFNSIISSDKNDDASSGNNVGNTSKVNKFQTMSIGEDGSQVSRLKNNGVNKSHSNHYSHYRHNNKLKHKLSHSNAYDLKKSKASALSKMNSKTKQIRKTNAIQGSSEQPTLFVNINQSSVELMCFPERIYQFEIYKGYDLLNARFERKMRILSLRDPSFPALNISDPDFLYVVSAASFDLSLQYGSYTSQFLDSMHKAMSRLTTTHLITFIIQIVLYHITLIMALGPLKSALRTIQGLTSKMRALLPSDDEMYHSGDELSRIGIHAVDTGRKKIVELQGLIVDAVKNYAPHTEIHSLGSEMLQQMRTEFTTEERLMLQVNYPKEEREKHTTEHILLRQRMTLLIDALSDRLDATVFGALQILNTLTSQHFSGPDMDFGSYYADEMGLDIESDSLSGSEVSSVDGQAEKNATGSKTD